MYISSKQGQFSATQSRKSFEQCTGQQSNIQTPFASRRAVSCTINGNNYPIPELQEQCTVPVWSIIFFSVLYRYSAHLSDSFLRHPLLDELVVAKCSELFRFFEIRPVIVSVAKKPVLVQMLDAIIITHTRDGNIRTAFVDHVDSNNLQQQRKKGTKPKYRTGRNKRTSPAPLAQMFAVYWRFSSMFSRNTSTVPF